MNSNSSVKNKYLLMNDSIVTDTNGNAYPDLVSFPINDFTSSTKPIEYKLSFNDTQRFFALTNSYYGNFPFYDDFSAWQTDMTYVSDYTTNFGRIILLYSKNDIDTWFLANLK